ncbi:MAG: MerR family DNA-binding transcriptional regulator, partial [Eggerthella lenta]
MGKEEFASVTAAAQALGVSADTIRRWSKLGLIKSTRDKNQKRMF